MSEKQAKTKAIKTEKDPDHKLLEESTIDKKKKEEGFLNKRNIILIVIFSIVAAVVLFLTFRFILVDINWQMMFKAIADGFVNKIGILWFSLLFLGIIFAMLYNWVPIAIRIRKLGIKIKFWDWFLLGGICSFIKAITPANFVVDPLTIFWLKNRGLSTSRATGLMFTNAFFWEVVQIIVKMPSFIMIMINVQSLLKAEGGLLVLILMCVGYAVDFIGFAVMLILCLSKNIHYALSSAFNWAKKKLHMKYHTKAQITAKYKERAIIKQDFIFYLKDWKTTILVILSFTFFELYTYMIVLFGMYFVQHVNGYTIDFNFGVMFNSSNMATTANRINILPNGELGIEGILNVLIKSNPEQGWLPVPDWPGPQPLDEVRQTVAANGIFLSRVFWAYFPAIIGFIMAIPVLSVYIHKQRMKHPKHKKN